MTVVVQFVDPRTGKLLTVASRHDLAPSAQRLATILAQCVVSPAKALPATSRSAQ